MKKIIAVSLVAIAGLFFGVSKYHDTTQDLKKAQIKSPVIEKYVQNNLNFIKDGKIPIRLPGQRTFFLSLVNRVNAQDNAQDAVGDPACEKIIEDAFASCSGNYEHGALGHFNSTLCNINDVQGANVENVFCHFRLSMGIEPDMSVIASDETIEVTEEFGKFNINVNVEKATENFATSNGYLAKATVTIDGSTYMVIYWGYDDNTDVGEGTPNAAQTKGFLIEGYVPGGIGDYRASYMMWDLTSTDQSAKMLTVNFPSAESSSANDQTPANHFLGDATAGSEEFADSVYYGRFKLNSSTNVTSVQGIMIEPKRTTSNGTNDFGCFKIYGVGNKTGQMLIAKSRDAISTDGFNVDGHFNSASTSNALNTFDDMDAACLLDQATTPNFEGNLDSGSTANNWRDNIITLLKRGSANTSLDDATNVFDIDCDTLNTQGNTGGISSDFAFSQDHGTSWVDFNAAPSDVFPTEANDLEFPNSGLCDNVGSDGTDGTSGCYCGVE